MFNISLLKIKILGHLEAGKDSKENIRNLMQDLSPNTPKTLIENKEKLNNISLIKEETQPYISRNNSKIDKISNRSQISIKTNKNSTSARSITPTPKKKQLVVQNHYLNKEANSYSSIMKHKKNENLQTYKKLLNCSNVDKNANYKNVIYQTSQKNIKNPNNFTNSNNKIKGSENKPNNKEKISNSKENINLQNLGKNNHCSNNGIPIKFNMKIQMTSSDISQNDDNLVYNVKNDFQNLKNQYSDKFTKIIDTFNERESKKEEIAQALSLKDRINQAIARRKTHENEENNIDIKQVIDLLPNYDPESNKNEMSDDNDEDSD